MNNKGGVLSQEHQIMFAELHQYQEHSQESMLGSEQSVIEADVNNAASSAKPDPKPRMKWTIELHENFVRAIDRLGGPDNAIPSAILRLMDVVGLTVAQVKSHLQKFRQGNGLRRLQLGNNTSSTADNSRRRPRKKAKVHRERGASSYTSSTVLIVGPQQQERGFQLPAATHGYDLHEVDVAESSAMNVGETLELPVVPTAVNIAQPLFPMPVVPDSGLVDGHVSSSLSPNKAPEINQQEHNFSFWDFQNDMVCSSSVFHYHSKGKVDEFPEFDESLWDL